MLETRMKEACRICARDLCGNQRRWIFHPASKLNLQVLLSHVLGRELSRDGKGEFACSKCTFMLDRMFHFDTVIARIEALSIERLQKLLQEKHRLRHCVASLYRKNNSDEEGQEKAMDCTVDISGLPDVKYNALLQEDFVYSGYESWAEHEEQTVEPHVQGNVSEIALHKSRKCRGCAALRVSDSDYEAVCKVPRKVARSISCGPSTRYSASVLGSVCSEDPMTMTPLPESMIASLPSDKTLEDTDLLEKMSPASSVEFLDTAVEMGSSARKEEETDRELKEDQKSDSWSEEHLAQCSSAAHTNKLDLALMLVKAFEYRPIQSPQGSKLPVLVKSPGCKCKLVFSDMPTGTPHNNICEFPSRFQELVPPRVQQELQLELSDLEELWEDVYVEYLPFRSQNLIEEQQSQLNQYECAAGQCVSELQKAQLQVQSLQTKIQETEATNKMLHEKLVEMDCELRAIRQASQKQERTIQGLSEAVSSKDSEAEELYNVIEGQNETLCKLRVMAHRNQLEQLQVSEGELDPAQLPQLQAELLTLQSSLFTTQLELQSVQRTHRQCERKAADQTRTQDRLHSDLQEVLQQREVTALHNQELRSALQKTRGELQEKEQLLKERESEKQMEIKVRETSIQRLSLALKDKEQLVQEYMELLGHQQDSGQSSESRDALLDKLRERIKNRDRALEQATDEKFRTLEEKEREVRELQLALREKDRDQDRLRCILSNNEETINSLDGLVKVKELELEQTSLACQNQQWLKQEVEEKYGHCLRERDGIITQLQTSLQSCTKEAEELTAVLLNKMTVGANEMTEELKLRLQLKERMFQEVLADRNRQATEHERDIERLLQAIGAREQQITETVQRLSQVIGERAGELQELRKQLSDREREVCELSRQREQPAWAPLNEISRLKRLLQEKEAFIEELMQSSPHSQEEPMITSKPSETGTANRGEEGEDQEVVAVKEELKLVMRKEQESRMDLSALQSALAKQKEEMQIQAADIESLTKNVQIKEELIKDLQRQLVEPTGLPVVERLTQELQELRATMVLLETPAQPDIETPDHQSVLEVLLSEHSRLNEALKAERQLYSSLAQLHTNTDSSENVQALQMELDAVQALRGQLEEALARTRAGAQRLERAARMQSDFGDLSSAEEVEEDEYDDDDGSTDYTDSIEEKENSKLTALSLSTSQVELNVVTREQGEMAGGSGLSSGVSQVDKEGLLEMRSEIQQLMEQKKAAESELRELKTQLENTGYASLSQMRNALQSLRLENDELKSLAGHVASRWWQKGEAGRLSEEGLKQEVGRLKGRLGSTETIVELLKEQMQLNCQTCGEEGVFNPELIVNMAHEIESGCGRAGPAQETRSAPEVQLREGSGKRKRSTRPHSLDLGALLSQSTSESSLQAGLQMDSGRFWEHVEASVSEQSQQLRSELALSRQESHELQERLKVSEATLQAQSDQLKHYHILLTEVSVEQENKQVQVDLQDLGYETCGRSETEADREEASSPEYDELDVHGDLYSDASLMEEARAPSLPLKSSLKVRLWTEEEPVKCQDVTALQQHIQDLRAQLCRSEKVIRNLQTRIRSSSTTSDYASSLERPHKVAWSFEASPAHSCLEDDEGWQSDEVAIPAAQPNKELQELVSRVASLETRLKTSSLEGKAAAEDLKSATWPRKYDSLIQAQARELSHLRQKMREGRGVCHILSQHLGDTTKSFEELLRANDIDYYMGQSFREQLAQDTSLAERVGSKLCGRDRSEVDDKTGHELLALRLSRELQQKDKIIESLRAKLQQRPDTPSSSHALSDSDRTSFVSDNHASTNDDLELCSDIDAASEYTQEERGGTMSPEQASTDSHSHGGASPQHPSIPSPTTASHGAQSNNNTKIPCSHNPIESSPAQKDLYSGPLSSAVTFPQTHYCSDTSSQFSYLPFDPRSPFLDPSFSGTSQFSIAEVHQELQMLQRQLGETAGFAVPHVKPLSHTANFSLTGQSQPQASSYTPLSHQPFQQASLGNCTLKAAEAGLLDSSAVWDMNHLVRPMGTNTYGDVSSGSSGYQSGPSHTGTRLTDEHLAEIRSLRQRLEDSIRTNERLRQQLEERLALAGRDSGPPTNIYIQGLESVSQLSNENQVLREENLGLKARLNQASRESCAEVEQLRDAVLSGRERVKQAELEAEQGREESRRLQAQSCEQQQEIHQLRLERQAGQDRNNRLQHEMNLLQQQLTENGQLLYSLQSELHVYERVYGSAKPSLSGYGRDGKCHSVPSSLDLSELLSEVRSLRVQLEQSIQENSSLRQQLEQQLVRSSVKIDSRPSSINISTPRETGCRRQLFQDSVPSPPVRDTDLFNSTSPFSMFSKYTDLGVEDPEISANQEILKPRSLLEGDAPDGSFASKNGRHTIGHVDDFSALQQQILEGKMLVQRMEAVLQSSLSAAFLEISSNKAVDYSSVKKLLSNTKTLRQILEEAASLLKMFWRAALPNAESCVQHVKKEQSMKEEIQMLRNKIIEQEALLQNTTERLRSTNHSKESMEHFIVSQLSRTRDVLKKAKNNLEYVQKNEYKISSLNSSPCPCKVEITRGHSERPTDWDCVSPRCHEPPRKKSSHRITKKRERSGQCLLKVVTY
ncbi:myomegalin-like isoform X1 [Acipenser oxyrinchus oxyrinchus]|uniref:Myomegalin-like isoform X1 n=1 Tax=Acipenser oxyrinchus oxyrinchus TaxID=40147 RepID=A0AAD8G0E7_ACIOX|nr:myomegalin-like isoform X1 [Acipenser oxyrinchus oxyrinchus]